jgi:type IV secretion system protein VirD4
MGGMQGFMALHQRTLEADHAARARRRAEEIDAAMRNARPSGLLGDGRLADLQDVQAAGLLDAGGLFLGAFSRRLIFFDGDGPLLTYLRTGGGKGRDLLLPNMAHLRNRSLIVVDVKDGENAYASAHHRSEKLGTKCAFLNPYGIGAFGNIRINPLQYLLDVLDRGDAIDTEAAEIAEILLPPSGKSGDDGWVRKGAARMLTTRMEYLAHFERDLCTLSGLWRFVNANHEQTETAYAMMATCGIETIERKAGALEKTLSSSPKQYEAYKAEAIDALNAFEPGKALARSTDGNDFDFAQLKHDPHTVYLMLPSDKLGVAASWISLILNYAIERIAKEPGRVRTTFMLDEFPQLPPAPAIMKSTRLYRGKGIQLWFFSQGRFSIVDRWSREAAKEFEDQAAVMTLKGVREPDLIRDIELWSGNQTVLMRGVSHNGGTVETASANLGEAKRAVLQSEDIVGLGRDEQILRIADMPRLLKAQTVPYFAVSPWRDQLKDVRSLHDGTGRE